MRVRRLGRDGPEVPVVGLGTWPLAGGMGSVDRDLALSTIHAAVSNGLTLIDTAEGYGDAEAIVGQALCAGRRASCFIATKVSADFSRRGVERAIENSLRALHTDYVDLYQVHRFPANTPIEETMEAMHAILKAGKARYVGVSNFTVEQLGAAERVTSVVSNQVNYNLFLRSLEKRMLSYCRAQGIGLIAHSTLGKGLLTGSYHPGHMFPDDDERSRFPLYHGRRLESYLQAADELSGIAAERGLSVVELALAWALRIPQMAAALVGATDPNQVEIAAGAAEIDLSDDELLRIDRLLADRKLEPLAPNPSQVV